MFSLFKKKPKPTPEPKPQDIAGKKRIPTRHIYTDKFGNKWFEYVNLMTIPAKRTIRGEVSARFASMKMTPDEMRRIFAAMKKAGNQGNFTDVFALISECEFRLEFIAEEKTLAELAKCYFLIDGEDETDMTEMDMERKQQVFDTDSDCAGFFLDRAFQLTMEYSEHSDQPIQEYLKTNIPDSQMLNHLLQRLK